MEVKQAVETAKAYLADLFSGERIANVGLEEVEFDESLGIWHITLGFSRPWDTDSFAAQLGVNGPRSYKIVNMTDANGKVVSVKNRSKAAA